MKVYKFGGASVKNAEGVRNLCDIVTSGDKPIFVVVSAMGQTTNALEMVFEAFMKGNKATALKLVEQVKECHGEIIEELFGCKTLPSVDALWGKLISIIDVYNNISECDYDRWYDRIVSFGELISTSVISEYLNYTGVRSKWVDMQQSLITDGNFREANVDKEVSRSRIAAQIEESYMVYVMQGFIGATANGQPTTLGREGSDYTAAIVANMIGAESLTIWKDVEGILNGDPKIFPEAKLIKELTYLDAIELSYSGAQIIHPKTIKPLQNCGIPLYVKPFGDKTAEGSVIKGEIASPIDVPILILKSNQVLVSIRPKDFSFVLAERMGEIIAHFDRGRVKINLIQSSAVNLSFCVDNSRHLPEVVSLLKDHFVVKYNDSMELLTIRGYNHELIVKYAEAEGVYLSQKTRRIVRMVRKK